MIKMKDSHIDWLGEIPAHWEIKRLKSIFSECKETSSTGEEDLLSVSEYYGVARRQDIKEEDEFDTRADSLEGYKICRKGDLVINIMLAWKRGLGFSDFEGIVSPAYAVYRGKNIVPHYYHYLLRTDRYIAEFKRNSKGIIDSRLRLYTDRFFNIKTIVPPIKEQQDIADYLDRRTADIDNQISLLDDKLQAYIKLKKSLISEIITHGLNPHIELKDSGIEWIGEIPAHWELKRIKDVCTVYCGATPKDNANYWDGNITWISPADMPEFGEIEEGARTITEEGYQSCGTSLVPAGSIVISTRAPIGKTNIALKELCTNQGCKCLTSKKLIMRYMLYFIWSKKEQFQALGRGTTFMELSTKDLSIFPLAIPPRQEQQAIADYLDKKTIEIDNQISLIGKKISAYKRLKQSLIDEVVTGKRKLN